jgi:hypothetical protein
MRKGGGLRAAKTMALKAEAPRIIEAFGARLRVQVDWTG